MSGPVSRRAALSAFGAAGAGLAFSGTGIVRGQSAPIVVGGRAIEIAVTALGPATVRMTLRPLADGRALPVPDDGALLEAASRGTTARHREPREFGTIEAGELRVRFTENPPTLHVETASGRLVQRLTLDRSNNDVSFLLPEGPLLGMGEGGPQFDRKGSIDEMRNGQRGYRLRTHGGRVPIQWLVGTDEYLWGRDLLVAPVVEKGAASRHLYLPRGTWHDYWTEERLEGGREVDRAVDLVLMPLYVRAGAVIPHDPVRQYTSEPVGEPATLVVYPGADGAGRLYEDDGVSFDYKQGDWMGIDLRWRDAERRLSLVLLPGSRMRSPSPRTFLVRVAGSNETRPMVFAGEPVEVTL